MIDFKNSSEFIGNDWKQRRECHERRTFNHFSFNKLSRSAVSLLLIFSSLGSFLPPANLHPRRRRLFTRREYLKSMPDSNGFPEPTAHATRVEATSTLLLIPLIIIFVWIP